MDRLSLSDTHQHVLKFGVDIYPPIEIASDRTRLNLFFEEVRAQIPDYCDEVRASDTEFRISKSFRRQNLTHPTAKIDTFVLTPRGPVFIFPVLLPLIGPVQDDEQIRSGFRKAYGVFNSALPGHKSLRLGVVREVVFHTGKTSFLDRITGRSTFGNSELKRAGLITLYRDDSCNIRISLDVGDVQKSMQLPGGKVVTEDAGFAVTVALDVNNIEFKPLDDVEFDQIITKALELWPDQMLEYLQENDDK